MSAVSAVRKAGGHSKRIIARMTAFTPRAPKFFIAPKVEPLTLTPVEPLSHGFYPIPSTSAAASLPFSISRTASKELPVYTDYRHGRTKLVTVLRRHSGDIDELSRQLSAHLQTKVAICNGRLEIVGDHVLEVKAWLAALGF